MTGLPWKSRPARWFCRAGAQGLAGWTLSGGPVDKTLQVPRSGRPACTTEFCHRPRPHLRPARLHSQLISATTTPSAARLPASAQVVVPLAANGQHLGSTVAEFISL